MRLQIPAIIAAYLSAEGGKDASGVALCFAEDATVSDERNVYRGRQAILEWQQKSHKKYCYAVEPLDGTTNEDRVRIHARLTGDFPGSSIEVDYLFRIADNQISSLEIR